MSTNQDILAFLREEKEAREKEKESEKQTRAKERAEDMTKIAEMIRAGVRDEVQTCIKPVENRLAAQEGALEVLGKQVRTLMSEISALKEEVQQIRDFPAIPPPTQPSGGIGMNTSSTAVETGLDSSRATNDRNRGSEFDKKVVDICEKARRIIGLTPIDRDER